MNTSSRLAAALLSCLVAAVAARADDVGPRPGRSLGGAWHVIVDPYDTGFYDYRSQPYDAHDPPSGGYALDRRATGKSDLLEYNFDTSPTLNVPGDWNSQDPKLLYYEGAIWYRTRFDAEPAKPSTRLFLRFGAANYEAHVYLNGRKLGTHVGGFTPFSFEVTGRVQPRDNSLVVRVDNRRRREGVPTLNTDWWNYGGLTRDVTLVCVPAAFVRETMVQLSADGKAIMVRSRLDGAAAGEKATVSIPELKAEAAFAADASGNVQGTMPVPAGLVRWSPERPRLYDVVVSAGGDRLADRIGFRTIETRDGAVLLNGTPVFLRGVSIHEENPLRGGRAHSMDDAKLLLGWARELGCNFVRLAHYPHNENMARLADEMGVMVWEEVPVYWTIQWENEGTLANARQQLGELVRRDRNRAGVIVWSVANETPVGEARTHFLKTLIDDARSLDGTRLVSAAMEVHGDPADPDARIVDDPLSAFTDLASFNEYVGWYDGLPDKIGRLKWTIKSDKPVVLTEFGAGAVQGFHADALTRFSEEYQEAVYRETLAMVPRIPHLSGLTPWILADFRSPRRPLPGIQDGWNRKGLVSQGGIKKKAFAVLQRFYSAKAREAGQ